MSAGSAGFILGKEPTMYTFTGNGGAEMLRVSGNDFYVRGVKVEQGPGEAKAVYEGFLEALYRFPQDDALRAYTRDVLTAMEALLGNVGKSTDTQIELAIFKTQAQQLRDAAQAIERKDEAIQRCRDLLALRDKFNRPAK